MDFSGHHEEMPELASQGRTEEKFWEHVLLEDSVGRE